MQNINTFREFWPYYLAQHSKSSTKWLHAIGTVVGLATAAFAVLTAQYRYLGLALVIGYGCAWASHFFIEKNKPATFSHPIWSFICDFIMLGLLIFYPKNLQR